MELKIVVSDSKTGKSYQKIVKDADAKRFVGLKIGDTVRGEILNFAGYEFEVTGGSDYAGFPMRRDVTGAMRKKILTVEGVGVKKQGKGIKQRKTVAGNTVHEKTSQVNMKITKYGKAPLGEEKKEGEEAAAAEGSAEKPSENPSEKPAENTEGANK